MCRVIFGSESHFAIFRSIGVTVFELSPGHFYKVALQHFLLGPITPPLINFFDVKLLFLDSKLYVEYDSTIILGWLGSA